MTTAIRSKITSKPKARNKVKPKYGVWSVLCLIATTILFACSMIARTAEFLVHVLLLAIVGGVAAWYLGYIPDAVVAEFATSFGFRALALAHTMGIPITAF
mgnify:FL=1